MYSGRVELAGKYIETGLRARRMRACPRLARISHEEIEKGCHFMA